jgi:HlyD family secretion protein
LLIPNAALRFSPPADERLASRQRGDLIQKLLPRPPRRRSKQTAKRKTGQKRNRVWTLRNGQLTPVQITIGATDGSLTVFTGGNLEPDDVVVIEQVTVGR